MRLRGLGWEMREIERIFAQFPHKNASEIKFVLIRELLKKDRQLRKMLWNYVLSSELFKDVSKPRRGAV